MTGDIDLRNAFREFADAANPYVRPPGADLAQRDARARARTRRLVVACAAAVAVLVPVSVVAVAQWRGGAQSLPVPPATEPAVTTAPTATSSPTVTATPTTTSTPPSPDGELTTGPGQLVNTTLTVSWSDPEAESTCGGPRTISDSPSDSLLVLSTMSFDVDRDGTAEIVANLFCLLGQVGPVQLVALRLDGATATVLGTVLATAPTDGQGALEAPDGPGVATILGYVGLEDGTVQAEVANKITCCGIPQESAVVQQRGYAWTGSSFQQVAGPTTFVADPSVANLEVTVPTLAFSAPVDGFRSATLTVSLHNNGPQAAAGVSVFLSYSWGVEEPAGGDWGRCQPRYTSAAVCSVGDIAPGQTVTLTLPMRRSSQFEAEESPHLSTHTGRAEARTGTRYYPAVAFDLSVA